MTLTPYVSPRQHAERCLPGLRDFQDAALCFAWLYRSTVRLSRLQMAFVPATCPQCGGDLQVPDDRETVNCMYCGTKIKVREAIKIDSGPSTADLLDLARHALESENASEANRLAARALERDPRNVEAWMLKGLGAGWSSRLVDFRLPECTNCFRRAHEIGIPEADREEAATKLATVALGGYNLSRNHLAQFPSYDMWPSHVDRAYQALEALKVARLIAPDSIAVMKAFVTAADQLVQGHTFVDWQATNEWSSHLQLTPEAKSELVSEVREHAELIKEHEPDYTIRPAVQQQSSGCFIATACYGAEEHPEVASLRLYRDEVLLRTTAGKAFVAAYYRISPPIAFRLKQSEALSRVVRRFLVAPLARSAAKSNLKRRAG